MRGNGRRWCRCPRRGTPARPATGRCRTATCPRAAGPWRARRASTVSTGVSPGGGAVMRRQGRPAPRASWRADSEMRSAGGSTENVRYHRAASVSTNVACSRNRRRATPARRASGRRRPRSSGRRPATPRRRRAVPVARPRDADRVARLEPVAGLGRRHEARPDRQRPAGVVERARPARRSSRRCRGNLALTVRPSAPGPGCSARRRSARRTPQAGPARTATPQTASAGLAPPP